MSLKGKLKRAEVCVCVCVCAKRKPARSEECTKKESWRGVRAEGFMFTLALAV